MITRMNSSRICRCLRLMTFLESWAGRGIDEFARECGVSRRTIYRDLHALEDAGIPVRYDSGRGVHLIEPHFKPSISPLTADEIVFLALAASTSVFAQAGPFAGIIRQSVDKILAQTPVQDREQAANLLRGCRSEFPDKPPREEDGRILGRILTAIRLNHRVRIRYCPTDKTEKSPQSTCVAPYRLVASAGGWRLTGRSSVHREVRCFELRQILRAEVTTDTFDVPPKFRRKKAMPAEPLG